MPLEQSSSKELWSHAEIIICRAGAQCQTTENWPCQHCLYIEASECWIVEELLRKVARGCSDLPAGGVSSHLAYSRTCLDPFRSSY